MAPVGTLLGLMLVLFGCWYVIVIAQCMAVAGPLSSTRSHGISIAGRTTLGLGEVWGCWNNNALCMMADGWNASLIVVVFLAVEHENWVS